LDGSGRNDAAGRNEFGAVEELDAAGVAPAARAEAVCAEAA
jgi:hypothetical protein